MSGRLMSRALAAVAVAALIVPALGAPAAAARGVAVPSIEKVAQIYPYLAGGGASTVTDGVPYISKRCKSGKDIKGATRTSVAYSPVSKPIPPGSPFPPYLSLMGAKFASAASAARYLTSTLRTITCRQPGGGDYDVKIKKFKVSIGDEGVGYISTAAFPGQTYEGQTVLVRKGKFVVFVSISSYNGPTLSRKRTVKLAGLAVRTAS